MNSQIISAENNIAIFWTKNIDQTITLKVLDDISMGYNGNFDKPVSEIDKDIFLSKYNYIINNFIKKWNLVFPDNLILNPTIQLAWNRNYEKGDQCLRHYHSTYPNQKAFSVVHMIKQETGHPNLWFEYNDVKYDNFSFKKDDIVIFPCTLIHGVDKNKLDINRITFVFDFTVEELCSS